MVQEEALFDAFMKQAEESYLNLQSLAFCINRRHALVKGAWLALSALPFSPASHAQRPPARLLELLLERASQIAHELDGMTTLGTAKPFRA